MLPRYVMFICKDIKQRVHYGFKILLPAADMAKIFSENLNISRITKVPKVQHQLHLTINLLKEKDKGTPSANNTIDREVSPELMQFGKAFPSILKAIWEADPAKGLVRVSELDLIDAYHCGTLWESQVGTSV